MISSIIGAATCIAVLLVSRKISKQKLPVPIFYCYIILFMAVGAQFYSIGNYGMTLKGVETSVFFFNDFFSQYLPNKVIQGSCFISMFLLAAFCLPKHPNKFPSDNRF